LIYLPYHWQHILPLYEQEYQVYADEMIHKNVPTLINPSRNGWVGVCFGSPDLVNPKKIFYAKKVEFDWDVNPPEEGRNWSVLLTGFIQSPVNGELKFYVSSQQNVKFFVQDKILIDKSSEQKETFATIYMKKDQWYPVRIEYDNIDFVGSNIEIFWSWSDHQKQSINAERLKHSEYQNKKANRTLVLGF